MKKEFTCIVCPNGCDLEVEIENRTVISVAGAICKRGEEYARQEITAPKRTIASSVCVEGGEIPLVSVRITKPILKEMIFPVMEEIKKITLQAPVKAGDILVENILETGSCLIATKDVAAR